MGIIYIEPLPRNATKANLLDMLDTACGLNSKRVGRIELHGGRATVEVPDGWESRLIKMLDGRPLGGQRLRVSTPIAPHQGRGNEDHFQRLLRLLDLESRAEAKRALEMARRTTWQEAQKLGNTLAELTILNDEAGLGGRYLVSLGRRNRAPLPWTRLDVGSPVVLSPHKNNGDQPHRGVIYERDETAIGVALDRLPEDLDEHDLWRLDLSFDEVAVQRQRAALEQARVARGDRFAILRDVLLGKRQPEHGIGPDIRPMDRSLNEVQLDAVRHAMNARDVALVHGPPGTGKTTAIVEIIRQAIRRGGKVLACAPSHLAVDNLFERLLDHGEKVVRLGHPARVSPKLRSHTVDLLVEQHPDVRVARKLVKQAVILFRDADRFRRTPPKPGERKQLREDAKSLLADARRIESQAVESILDSARVLCATTTGLDNQILGRRRFDLAVIDEACQSIEPGCWIPILRSDRVVLAGDHCQLPPTVVSQEATDEGFGVSIFERLMALYGQEISRRLTVQYRMNRSIMNFSSQEFYDGQLEAHETVETHLLADLPHVTASPLTQTPIEFLDTAGAGFDEEQEPDGESRLNRQEAGVVCRMVRELLEAGVAAQEIAVISPYAAQVRLLREQIDSPDIEVDSIDGFQGREKEAVVISLVRSNSRGEIGFLRDIRRMNVAMTRARRKLILIGDSATLGGDPFYQRMLDYFEQNAGYRTIWELV